MSESATAAVFRRVAELRAQGVDLVSLSVGEPDFDPPAHVSLAAKHAIDAGASRYTEVVGLRSLREAICQDSADRRGVAHEPDQVVVSAGAKHALFNLAQALYDHGDEVVIPVPAWGTYAEQARLCGATPVLVPCLAEDGFLVRPQALADAMNERTKAVVLCSPSNPTGAAYAEENLRALARVLEGSRAVVIVDEIYGTLTYDGFVQRSLLTLAPALRERLVIVDGVSKRFAMTGYRVGWMLAPRPLARACEAIQSQATTSIAAVAQHAAEAALRGPQDAVEAMRARFEARRDRLLTGLSGIDGLQVARPRGAFYLFVDVRGLIERGLADDVAVARHLLDAARVAVVPGSAFGAPGHIRLSYAAAEAELDRAVERIGEAVEGL
jgi:aspartate aminotransferase